MEKLKYLILAIITFISVLKTVSAQTYAGITSIGNYSACSGTITIHLNISGSPDIGSLSLEIDYDGNVLSFLQSGNTGQGVTNTNANLYSKGGSIAGVQSTISGSLKKLRLGWYSSDANAYSIDTSGTGILCDLSFRYFGGSTSLTFNNSIYGGQMCEYSTIDIFSNPIICIDTTTNTHPTTYYINGNIIQNTPSISAISASGTSPICSGSHTTLSITGGSLGIGAIWNWYSGSCGGTYVTSGTSPVLSPTVTTTYYVLAFEPCNTTACVNTTIIVDSLSTPAIAATATPALICIGDSSILSVSGGNLGTGAGWYWYSGSCGGFYLTSGSSPTLKPTATITYYVRAEGTCNITSCVNTIITVNTNLPSTAGNTSIGSLSACLPGIIITVPLNIINSPDIGSLSLEIDYDGNVLSFIQTGGITNINGNLQAHSSLGIVGIQSDISITSRMLRLGWFSNDGNAYSVGALGSGKLCDISFRYFGGNTSLIFNNSVAYGNMCEYSTIMCNNFITCIDTPTVAYYINGNINQNTASTPADSAKASSAIICAGHYTTLGISGGNLGIGENWKWYIGSCGGTYISSGSSPVLSPTVTTTYYVLAAGACNSTACASITVLVYGMPSQSSEITGNTDPQFGTYEQYSVINDSNITNYYWTSPTDWINTSTTNSINYLVGANSGLITLTPSNVCGSGVVRTLHIETMYSLTGYFTYDNIYNTPLDSVEVFLKQNENIIYSTQADINGFYEFPHVAGGIYNITATTNKPCGGINGTDVLIVQRDYLGIKLLSSSLTLHAADVNLSNSINGTDVLLIQRYFLNIINNFPRGNWIFEKQDNISDGVVPPYYKDTVTVFGGNILQDIEGICVGDVNGSYIPGTGAKQAPKVSTTYNSVKKLNSDEYFEIPVKVTDNIFIGAISLIINFPKDLVEIIDVKLNGDKYNQLLYNVQSNKLRIIWDQDDKLALNLHKNDTLLIVKIKTKDNFKLGDIIRLDVDNNSLCELASPFGIPIDYTALNIPEIEFLNNTNIENFEDTSFNFDIYPNPSNNFIKISYNIINDEFVNISLFNALGEMIENIENRFETKGKYNTELDVSSLQPGIYTLRILLNNNSVIIRKLVIFK